MQIEPATKISLTVFGIGNPGTFGPKSITLNVLDSSNYHIEDSSKSIQIDSNIFAAMTFTVNSYFASPNNPRIDAKYTFTFSPNFIIPKDSLIKIYFNSTYDILYGYGDSSQIRCLVTGGITTLQACSVDDGTKSISMTTDTNSMPNKEIALQYYGLIKNPTETKPGFNIEIYFSSILIAKAASTFSVGISSPNSNFFSYRFFYSFYLALMSNIGFTFYPKNEGEIAYYVFTFSLISGSISE